MRELGPIGTLQEEPADWARVTRCRSSQVIAAPDKRNIATGVQSSTNIYSITAGSCLGKPPLPRLSGQPTPGMICPTQSVHVVLLPTLLPRRQTMNDTW